MSTTTNDDQGARVPLIEFCISVDQPMPGWRPEEQALAVAALLAQGVDPSEFSEGGSPEWGPSALVWAGHFAISPRGDGGFVIDTDAARPAVPYRWGEFPSAAECVLAYLRGEAG